MKHLKPAILLLVLLTAVTGVIYPLVITGIARIAFPKQANGSLVLKNGRAVGSELIGQVFDDPRYFWSRPSATGPYGYNAGASTGSNFGPLNPALAAAIKARIEALRAADPATTGPVPVDLVTTSASGLDPDLSPAAALYQVPRVARARGLDEERLRALVISHIKEPQFGLLGEPRVNVLELNLVLDSPMEAAR